MVAMSSKVGAAFTRVDEGVEGRGPKTYEWKEGFQVVGDVHSRQHDHIVEATSFPCLRFVGEYPISPFFVASGQPRPTPVSKAYSGSKHSSKSETLFCGLNVKGHKVTMFPMLAKTLRYARLA